MNLARDHKGWFWHRWLTEQCRQDAVEDMPELRMPDGEVDIAALDRLVPREYFALTPTPQGHHHP